MTDSKGLKAEDITIVNVSSTNRPPQGQAGAAQTVTGQSLVTLDGSASSDPDDGIASYRWTRVSGPPVKLSDPRLPRPSFRAPRAGAEGATLRFQLLVSDYGGLQSKAACSVRVGGNN